MRFDLMRIDTRHYRTGNKKKFKSENYIFYVNLRNFVQSFICTRLKDECGETSGILFREALATIF